MEIIKSIESPGTLLNGFWLLDPWVQVWPALLEKKDRGRGADLTTHPKAYGEAVVSTGIPGAELLLEEDVDSEEEGSDKEDEEGEEDNDEEGVDILSEDGEVGSDADLIDSDEDLEGWFVA